MDKEGEQLRFVAFANSAKGYCLFDKEKKKILIISISEPVTGKRKWKSSIQRMM